MKNKAKKCERSFLLMICLYPVGDFSGYYLNPFKPPDQPTFFDDYKEFENLVFNLINETEIKDFYEETVPVFINWYKGKYKNMTRYIVYINHLCNGRITGNIFDTSNLNEISFSSKNNLRELLILLNNTFNTKRYEI